MNRMSSGMNEAIARFCSISSCNAKLDGWSARFTLSMTS